MDFDFTTETITPDNTNILTIGGTGALELPSGTTLQEPLTAIAGAIRWNTTNTQVEYYTGAAWTTFSNAGVASFSAGTTGLTPNTATTGTVTLAGTLATTNGGTGLATIGTANQILGVNTAGTSLEYKSIVAGTGISITPAAGSLTIASTGAGGGVYTFQYHARTNTQAASNPGSGNLVWNNATLTSATQLYISATDSNGVDQSVLFAFLTTSNVFYVQDADLSSTFQRWHITSITNNTGWYTLGVTLLTSANFATMSNNHNIYTGWAATTSSGVTSVGLALPSIFNVSGSPVTTSGTLTGTLATQSANTIFAGPTISGPSIPTFRTLGLATNDINDVTITSATTNQVLAYNGSRWVNTGAVGANATGTIGVSPTGGGTAWTLISGTSYRADFVHNLGTTNVVITVYDTNNNAIVIPNLVVTTDANTVRVTVTGNTKTLKVVVVANGQSIVAGGSTPSSVITAKDGVTVSTAATKLNFTGQAVNVADAGAGTTNITIGSRFTFFANSLDTPVNSDFAVNAIAATVTDPTYASLNVRSFSNSTEQGVATLISIPTGATTLTIKMRGRAQTAPGAASVVQPRLYYRLLPNNSAVGAWSAAQELANIAIPTNANFQYSTQSIALSTLGMTAGNLYQIELTRRVSGVTGTNLAANYLMAELTLEIA
jgi:hypothetical protein